MPPDWFTSISICIQIFRTMAPSHYLQKNALIVIAPNPAPIRRRLIPLRSGLIVATCSVALTTLGAFFASVYIFVYKPATQELAATSLKDVSLVIAAVAVATVLLASFLAVRLAKRIREPLDRLASESARIGRLDLEQPVDVHSPWLEIDAVAHAHESMRVQLLEAIQRLEQDKESLEIKVNELTRELADVNAAALCPPTHSLEATLDIPGLDVVGSIQRLGGLEHVYFSALRLFIRGHSRAPSDIRAALDAGEHDKAVRLSHTLKGVAGTVGAFDVERAANALGMALAENAPRSAIDPLLKTLSSHLDEVVARAKLRLPEG
jgi:HPt (histidine-containing phosphotransfer) domain-containing protein